MDENKEDNSGFPDLNKFKLPLALTIVGLTLLSAGIYYTMQRNSPNNIKFSNSKEENSASSSAGIVVHVAGEIMKPGVYELSAGSRVNDLFLKAGGFTLEADQDYIDKSLNLAQILKDGAKIYIPKKGETSQNGGVAGIQTGLINLNSASLSELDALPDIGAVRAQKIIDARPFQKIEELVEKKIIGQAVFEKIKDKITVY